MNTPQKSPTVAVAIAELLAKMGARRCFGVLGTANFKITHALSERNVKYLAARHEAGAVSMADAYVRLSDEFAVVSVHSGPGLTNAITAVAEAAKAKTPLLVLAGDVARGDFRSNFHIRQADLVRSIGARFEQIESPGTALQVAARAALAVTSERATVVLSLPVDVQDSHLPESAAVEASASVALPGPPPEAVVAIAEELVRAKRPLIIAGRGAVVSGAKNVLIELGDELGALLATSAFANGLFADEPWNTGISGGFSSPAALNLIPQSDFVLGFGVSFTHWTTRSGQLIGKNAKVLQVDIDRSRLGVNCRIDYGITGDVSSTAAALLAALRTSRGNGQKSARWRQPQVLDQITAGSIHKAPYTDTSTKEHIDPRTLTKELDKILPLERVVVTDSGHFMGWPPLYFRVPDERGWCQPTSFQSVGLGMASAIGAALAQPHRLVTLAIGDGGLLMSLGELETAVRLGVRMCVVVYNDLAYGAEVHYFGRRQYSVDIVRFANVDFSAIARGVGASSVEVRTVADLAAVQKWVAEKTPGIFLIDARITPHLEAEWHQDAFKISA